MTQGEAIAEIKRLSQNTLTAEDIRGLVGCTPNQLAWIIRGYADQCEALKQRTVWEQIRGVLAQVPEWIALAKDIATAIGLIATIL